MVNQSNSDLKVGLLNADTVAPVVPTANADVRYSALGLRGSRIEAGLWAERRRTNHNVTIPHGAAELHEMGTVFNFELAAGRPGQYRAEVDDSGTPAPFLDSDVYKWLEAVGWELSQTPDRSLADLAEPMIDLIAKAQRPDGYVDTFYQVTRPGREFTDLQWGHELYVAGHLVQAAVAWKRGLGDERLLRVAQRFSDRIGAELGPGRRELICGHPEFEMAMVELYRTTGEARYLELARTLIDRRGRGLLGKCRHGSRYWQDHEPVRSAAEPAGHAVRQMYLDCGVVDVAVETGDRELLDSAIRRWDSMVSNRMYLTGGLGAHHRDEAFGDAYELPPDRAYAETCAAIGSVMLSWRLLLATGDERYADLIERTAFNAVLPGLSFDGSHFFYSNPLLRRTSVTEIVEGNATTRRSPWPPIACCPPNLMRFLATFPDLVATTDADGVQLHQFVSGSLEAQVRGGTVRLSTTTNYPWDGTVEIEIGQAITEPWTLSMRVPAWCSRAIASVGEAAEKIEGGPGRIEITRRWRVGERIVLTMDMPARVTLPDSRIDAVRGTMALERGPIVYAVEDEDLTGGHSVESMEVDPATKFEVASALDTRLGDLPSITFEADFRADVFDKSMPYRDSSEAATEIPTTGPKKVTALPYLACGNRAGLGMRVWIPTRTRAR